MHVVNGFVFSGEGALLGLSKFRTLLQGGILELVPSWSMAGWHCPSSLQLLCTGFELAHNQADRAEVASSPM
jgi:hypothetical protein